MTYVLEQNDVGGTGSRQRPGATRPRSKMMSTMNRATAVLSALVLSIGLSVATPTADGQDQTGLVNVAIGDITTGDILSNNQVNVGVAAQIATNVCGVPVQVGVLSLQLQRTGSFKCSNSQTGKFVQVNS
jgi:hypothetical protein